jgi:hypothetical protein
VQEDSDGFTTVTYEKKPNQANPVNTVKKRYQHPIGVQNCVSHPVISEKEKSRAHFVSCFSPKVMTVDVEKSLIEQLSLKTLVCTRCKSSFNSCASFHLWVKKMTSN